MVRSGERWCDKPMSRARSRETASSAGAGGAVLPDPYLTCENGDSAVRSAPLYRPSDDEALSELLVLVRQQIEAFVATHDDVRRRGKPRGGHIDHVRVGSVGIRCIHCARNGDGGRRARGAVSYPTEVRLVYQVMRNYQRHHLLACGAIPDDVKSQYLKIQGQGTQRLRRSVNTPQYLEDSLRCMGMIEVEGGGIRLRNGRFEGDDEGEEAGDGNVNGVSMYKRSHAVKFEGGQGSAAVSDEESGSDNDVDTLLGGRRRNGGPLPTQTIHQLQDAALADENRKTAAPGKLSTSETRSSGNNSVNALPVDPMNTSTVELRVGDRSAIQTSEAIHGTSSHLPVGPSPFSAQQSQASEDSLLRCETSGTSRGLVSSLRRKPTANGMNNVKNESTTAQQVEDIMLPLEDGKRRYAPELEQSPSSLGFKFGGGGPDDDPCDAPAVSPSLLLSREELLGRVELAQNVVKVAGDLGQPPSLCGGSDGAVSQSEDLRLIGTELYELFTGWEWEGTEAIEDDAVLDDNLSHPQQRKKRETRPERKGRKMSAPLGELGLPASLCSLLSSLLDESGDGKGEGIYKSVSEVEQDLLLMVNHPEKYLFDPDVCGAEFHQLNISGALYGRSAEISKLLETYDRMVAGNERGKKQVVLVSGYSGMGKTSLVREVQRRYIQRGASFISGKFDAMQQMQPLSAIVGALNEYCYILAQDTGRLEQVREAVSTAMGGEGHVLVGLIPNLGEILLPAANERLQSLHALVPEAQHRLAFLIRMLLRSTCNRDRPVVLFLDDLQWADEASLELMHTLVTDTQLDALLLVGCYRNNEVGSDHPLTLCLKRMALSHSMSITTISVRNLDRESVNDLLSESLHLLPGQTRSLAEVVLQKTGGNALFVVQFLASLCDGGLLHFSLTNRRWDWDIDSIRAQEIAENVVEFVMAKLLRLAPDVHEGLKTAAAFGRQCQEDIFRIVDRDPYHLVHTGAALGVAVSEGLMTKVKGPAYRFSHDQIQSAAYQLIPVSDREAFHLRIGRSLWKHSSNEEMENYLFVVVDQLHRGAGLITDHCEKVSLAQLSLSGGKKALAMSAFLPALAYLNAGVGLIVDDDWESHRDLCFDLYSSCAETAFILGDFDGMKNRLEEIFQRARTLQEKLRAYYTHVQSLIAQGYSNDAIETALICLGQLGETFPPSYSVVLGKQELMATHTLLSSKTEEELRQLKIMEDTEKRQAMKLLSSILTPTVNDKKIFLPFLVSRLVRLSLRYGVCPESAFGFSCYGMIRCIFGDFAGGYRFGRLALSTLERMQTSECFMRVHVGVYCFITDWTEPLQSSLPPLKHAINVGLATGDTEYALNGAHLYGVTALASGCSLGPLYEEMKLYSEQMVEYKQQYAEVYNRPSRQAVLNLLGRSADPTKLVGEAMDEDKLLKNVEHHRSGPTKALMYFYRMWLQYLFGKYDLAAETAGKNQDLPGECAGRFATVCNFTFYSGLISLALARRDGEVKYADAIDRAMTQMKLWAASMPWNCQHKLELMNAEYAFLFGNIVEAAEGYNFAAELAAKHRFIHEEALALERAGIFYLETGDHDTASSFFVKAHDCYKRWGACSKASHVRESYL